MALIHQDRKVGFYPIFKCGSTTMHRLLGASCGFMADDHRIDSMPADYECFAIVRDPVDRWLSAAHTIWPSVRKGQPWPEFLVEKLDEPGVWNHDNDQHFRPQRQSLPAELGRVTLFPLERIDDTIAWLAERGIHATGGMPHVKRTPDEHRAASYALLRDSDREAIEEVYAGDLALYRSSFVGSP